MEESDKGGNVIDMHNYGACRYCGQIVNIEGEAVTDMEAANELATRKCSCDDARRYAESIRAREEAERMRSYMLRRARDQIALLFGKDAMRDYGITAAEEMRDEVPELIYQFAVLVYDEILNKAAINITTEIKATVSKNSKGRLQIQRASALTVKREV